MQGVLQQIGSKEIDCGEPLVRREEGSIQGLSQVQATISKVISYKVRCLHSS